MYRSLQVFFLLPAVVWLVEFAAPLRVTAAARTLNKKRMQKLHFRSQGMLAVAL
jgi:hypothetical protein